MKANVVVQERIEDEETFAAYRKDVVATLAPYDGCAVAQCRSSKGEWTYPRLVIIEFPSRAAAEGWYVSPAYQKLLPLRLRSCVGNLVIIDGAE